MKLCEYQAALSQIGFGKKVQTSLYLYRDEELKFAEPMRSRLARVVEDLQVPAEFNVIKLRTDELKISLLSYPEFFSEAHPMLKRAITVELLTGKPRHSDYSDKLNPPILHRKEQLLPPSHPRRPEFAALTEAEEAEGLYENTTTIGFKLNWERLLASKGLLIEGHELKRIESDWVQPSDQEEPSLVQRHRTALRRYELSKPAKCLLQYGLLKPGKSFFDYGCGLGTDIAGLTGLGYSASGWDPNYLRDGKKVPADVVNIGYVLNVIEDPVERVEALCGAWGLTRDVLIVAALIHRTVDEESARLLNDGVLTRWNTFQKFYDQKELQQYIEDALEATAIPVALGIYVAFRDPIAQQEFISRRTRRKIDWTSLTDRSGLGTPRGRRGRIRIEEYEQNRTLLEPFWKAVLERGRVPIPEEFSHYAELVERLGSARHAFRVVLDANGEEHFETAMFTRKGDLRVYLALSHLRKPVPLKHLSPSLREDMSVFFDSYKEGLRAGKELLFAAGDPGEIEVACEDLKTGWQDAQFA
jgi:DNA phosphorothioation-associated putative methyltransferase